MIIDAKIKAATPVEKNYKPGDTGQLRLFVSTAIGAKPSRWGPVVRYQLGRVPITAQWQHEFHAENRPQGDKFWLKAAFRF